MSRIFKLAQFQYQAVVPVKLHKHERSEGGKGGSYTPSGQK